MPIDIQFRDERDDKEHPPIKPEDFKVQPVIDFADIQTEPDETLRIDFVLKNGAQDGDRRTPTSFVGYGNKEELYELELTDAKTGKKVCVWQKRDVPDESTWEIHLLILPKDELGFGGMRALSRAISREIFAISAVRSYGEMLPAMFESPKDFADAQTAFADDAPWAVS